MTGLAGLAGALLFFTGDMLFYGHFGSGTEFAAGLVETVRHASVARLVAGGVIGPFAASLCIAGFWHVYLNMRPAAGVWGRVVLVSFVLLMIAGSAVHTLWAAKGLATKFCTGEGQPCLDVLGATTSYWALVYNVGAIPGYIGATVLIGLVLAGRTWYPRWTVLANPAVLIAFAPLLRLMPAPLGAPLVGGSANLSIAIFFLTSVLSTW
ncbi:MAG: DUF6796 family protein, partial [Gemmatimonadaceae bacterium]